MQGRSLGRDVQVTRLGLGASQFGNLYRVTSDDECAGAVEAAWDAGVRYFDTAPHYGLGLSERRLGALLGGKPRDEFAISTKVGRLLIPTPGRAGLTDESFEVPAAFERRWDFSADGVRRSLDESLTRLGLDRVDIVYLHDPDDFGDQAVAEALPALAALRDEGVIGAIGAGMNQVAMLSRFIREADIDVVMVAGRFTLLDHDALGELLPLAVEHSVAVVVAGVYNSGLLGSDRVNPGAMFDYAPAPAGLVERATQIAVICERHGVSLPEAALAYPLLHPAVASVVVGARNRTQVESNVLRFGAEVPPALWLDLQAAGLLTPGFPAPALTGETVR